jgi:hypothetical protein
MKKVFDGITKENICHSRLPINRPHLVKTFEEDGWIVSVVIICGRFYLLDVRPKDD